MIKIELTEEMYDKIINLIDHKISELKMRMYKRGIKEMATSNAQPYIDLKNNLIKQRDKRGTK